MAVSVTRCTKLEQAHPLCLQESQIKRIYSTMINQKLQGFKEELKPIGEILTQATLELYYTVTARFLPTPAKIHYLFNLRDISKVHKTTYPVDGLFYTTHTYIHTPPKICFQENTRVKTQKLSLGKLSALSLTLIIQDNQFSS